MIPKPWGAISEPSTGIWEPFQITIHGKTVARIWEPLTHEEDDEQNDEEEQQEDGFRVYGLGSPLAPPSSNRQAHARQTSMSARERWRAHRHTKHIRDFAYCGIPSVATGRFLFRSRNQSRSAPVQLSFKVS